MKKFLKTLFFISIGILILNCDNESSKNDEENNGNETDNTTKVIGRWDIKKVAVTQTVGGQSASVTYDRDFLENDADDELLPMIRITADSLILCAVSGCDGRVECDGFRLSEINATNLIIDDSFIDYDDVELALSQGLIDTTIYEVIDKVINGLTYSFDGNDLILEASGEGTEDGEPASGSIKLYFNKYDGAFPPADWLEDNNDSFEPNDDIQHATPIIVDANDQFHYLVCSEDDFFSFTAGENSTYTIEVSSDFDSYVKLYNSNGTLLDENDDDGEGLNPRLIFTAPSTGTYYFNVHGYYHEESEYGDYSVSVVSGSVITKTIQTEKRIKTNKPNTFVRQLMRFFK